MKETSMKSTNKAVLLSHWMLDMLLVAGYVVEYFKGGRTLPFVAAFLILLLVPIITSTVIYFRSNDSTKIKIITLIGFFIVYTFAIFTTDRTLVYVYMFPIILTYFLYFDLTLIKVACGGIFTLNVIRIAYLVFGLGIKGSSATTDYTIQFASVFLFSFSLITATKLSNRFSLEKLERIEEDKKRQRDILEDVLRIGAILDKNSNSVYDIVDQLASSTSTVTNAVTEIAKGVSDTAQSIQVQSGLTHNIQKTIIDTSKLSQNMDSISNDTTEAVNEGINIVGSLSEKTTIVNQSNENVYKAMLELKNRSNEIHNTTEIITGISEQTNLLSLNAAIESARAGEAGKGFAVVAEEIRKLAMQSKESAGYISNIIRGLQEKSDESVEAVTKLREVNREQTELILKTKDIFDKIIVKMKEVNENVDLVNSRINDILQSNDRIVESINEISAVSEEATANAQEATSMAEHNIQQANTAKNFVQELIETSKGMKKYIE